MGKRKDSMGGGTPGSKNSATLTELANKASHADRNTDVGGGKGLGEAARDTKMLKKEARKTGKV